MRSDHCPTYPELNNAQSDEQEEEVDGWMHTMYLCLVSSLVSRLVVIVRPASSGLTTHPHFVATTIAGLCVLLVVADSQHPLGYTAKAAEDSNFGVGVLRSHTDSVEGTNVPKRSSVP